MKSGQTYTPILIIILLLLPGSSAFCQLPEEQPLWPQGIPGNPVKYKEEKLRQYPAKTSSLSKSNRVFSCVSSPSFIIHKPAKGRSNGVAVVICPGGGFEDIWIDREGNDLALWLAEKGFTSLVLKYRTFNSNSEGFNLKWEDYFPQVVADARKAIYFLRSEATSLGIDKEKIGICGFSAGGSLSLKTTLESDEKSYPSYAGFTAAGSRPDFVGLFYPWLNDEIIEQAGKTKEFPPVFIMNGGEDDLTPAAKAIELYKALTADKISTEIHIYSKGGHGFDSGLGLGYGISAWRDSFYAWLCDRGFISNPLF